MTRRAILLAVSLCAAGLVLGGCAHLPRVSLPKISATAPAENGTPAKVATEKTTSTLPIPAGSVVEIQSFPAPKTPSAQPVTPQSAVRTPHSKITLAAPSALTVISERQAASTGTIDTTAAVHRLDNEARQPFLCASIACVAAALVFVFLKYPTPALMCGAGAGIFLLAWQLAALPPWVIGLGAVAAGGALFLYFGHERGEKSAAAILPAPPPA